MPGSRTATATCLISVSDGLSEPDFGTLLKKRPRFFRGLFLWHGGAPATKSAEQRPCALAYHIPICANRSRRLHKTKAYQGRTYGAHFRNRHRPTRRLLPLASAVDGHRLHGDGCKPAIWLDAVRRSHRPEISLGPRGDPVGLYAFRGDRDLACPGRSVVR